MKNHLRLAPVLLLAISLAGCEGPCQKIGRITGPAVSVSSGSADFTRYIAAGTSISTGYQSSGVVGTHQATSFPARFAQQIGFTVNSSGTGTFSFDAISSPGISPLLELRSLSPLIISNSGLSNGAPSNIGQAGDYQNLGVPGAMAFNFADTTWYYVSPPDPRYNPWYSMMARLRGSLAAQMLRQAPTFISWEYGANEVLSPAHAGNASMPFTTGQYAAIVTGAMNAIHAAAPTAKLALFTVPNVTTIPFCTTLKPYTRMLVNGLPTGSVVTLIGSGGTPLAPTDLVLLTAADSLAIGTGFPVGAYNYLNPAAAGNGRPLLDSHVLNGTEQTALGNAITAMNAAIDSVSLRPWIAKVDMGGLLSSIAANGYVVGSTRYTGAFVTGGIFSLDGVHPTDLGQAILANTMIAAVNARFGSTVPLVDLKAAGTTTSSSPRPALGTDGLKGMRIEGLDAGLRTIFPAPRY